MRRVHDRFTSRFRVSVRKAAPRSPHAKSLAPLLPRSAHTPPSANYYCTSRTAARTLRASLPTGSEAREEHPRHCVRNPLEGQ